MIKTWFRRHLPLLGLLVGALALTSLFLWPQAAHFASAIPHSSRIAPTEAPLETLRQGDHLQLLYHFQLARQILWREIPLFANPYEFNLGSDPQLFDPYYLPFSLLFALTAPLLGDAAAWNLAQLASVLIGALLLYLFAKRFSPSHPSIAALLSLAALCVPYRWETLAGGSPTGFGMAWLPGIALGIDILVRDQRARGGLLAGIMLLFCYTSDLHCFLFGLLSLPFWYLFSWLARPSGPLLPSRSDLLRITRASLPLLAFVALSGAIAIALRRMYAATDAAGGRTIADLKSPFPIGLIDPASPTFMASQIFLGWGILLLILLATFALLIPLLKRKLPPHQTRQTLALLLLALALLGAILLALAARGPFEGIAVRAFRKLIPPFKMVRQPIKVFCLLPVLLAPLWTAWIARSKYPIPLLCLALTLAIIPAARSMRTGLCLLPPTPNRAYLAAAQAHPNARALVLPIWPGDSSWSSIYLYHAQQTRLRMLNGYAAVKTSDYIENVFQAFETITQGDLTQDQIARLQAYGVTSILLHEDAFPEKVSPCPAATTLRRLLVHPHLALLAHDGPVWAFSLLPTPSPKPTPPDPLLPITASARTYPLRIQTTNPTLPLHHPASWMTPSFQWHLVDTLGNLSSYPAPPENSNRKSILSISTPHPIRTALYTANPLLTPPLHLPAADLFHKGFSLLEESTASLSGAICLPPHTPIGEVLYGPNLLLAPTSGSYTLTTLGDSLQDLTLSLSLGTNSFPAQPASSPLSFPAPSQPEILRISLHLSSPNPQPISLQGFSLNKP